jgi:small-conductance mechanosensitive channel
VPTLVTWTADNWITVTIATGILAIGLGLGLGIRVALGRFTRSTTYQEVGAKPEWGAIAASLGRDLSVVICGAIAVWIAVAVLPINDRVLDRTEMILVAVLILAASYAAARIAGVIVASVVAAQAGISGSASLFTNITRVVVVGIGFLVVLQTAGISITPLLGALGVGGLAVALALQDTLANLFAGIHILASKKVQVDDFVQLDSGEEGWIVDINWRNTTIRQIPGNMVIVPNHKFADAIITNFAQPEPEMNIVVECGVHYRSELEHVERVTIEVGRRIMRELDAAVTDHEPKVRFHTFGDSSIDFRVILRIREFADQYMIISEFIKALHRRFQDEGIEIPFPIRTLELPADLHVQRAEEFTSA